MGLITAAMISFVWLLLAIYGTTGLETKSTYVPKTEHTLESINIHPTKLTISSVLYNPTSVYSDWVDRLFGSKSVFYVFGDGVGVLDEILLTKEEVFNRIINTSTVFRLPEYAIWPPCSFEMLGFAYIGQAKPEVK